MVKVMEVSSIRRGTLFYLPEELCYNLSEMNLPGPNGQQPYHRYQILTVLRGDNLADYFIDLGCTSDFTADQLRIPTAVMTSNGRVEALHTVAQTQEMAVQLRDLKWDKSELPVFDLGEAVERNEEKRKKAKCQ